MAQLLWIFQHQRGNLGLGNKQPMATTPSHNPSTSLVTSVGDIIAGLVERLQIEHGYDGELLDILKTHILTEHPSPDAVEQAFSSITHLAVTRSEESPYE
jgi:hypothetical protein